MPLPNECSSKPQTWGQRSNMADMNIRPWHRNVRFDVLRNSQPSGQVSFCDVANARYHGGAWKYELEAIFPYTSGWLSPKRTQAFAKRQCCGLFPDPDSALLPELQRHNMIGLSFCSARFCYLPKAEADSFFGQSFSHPLIC